jgi:hypothetical protein
MAFIDIPNFPTESLHKFRAIVGLILMFGGLIYQADGLSTIQENLIDINTKTEILRIKTKYLHNESDFQAARITGVQLRGEADKNLFLSRKLIVLSFVNILVIFYGLSLARQGFTKWNQIQKMIDTALERESEGKLD